MKWLELHIDTARAGLEPVSELLREQGVEGLVIDDEADFKDFSKTTTSIGTMWTMSCWRRSTANAA